MPLSPEALTLAPILVLVIVLMLMRVIVDHHDGVCSGHSAAQHGFEHQRVIVDA